MQDTVRETGTSSLVMYSYGPQHMARQKQDDQLEHTYSSSVRIRDVALKTGISVPQARHDDDDIYIYIYMYVCILLFLWRLRVCWSATETTVPPTSQFPLLFSSSSPWLNFHFLSQILALSTWRFSNKSREWWEELSSEPFYSFITPPLFQIRLFLFIFIIMEIMFLSVTETTPQLPQVIYIIFSMSIHTMMSHRQHGPPWPSLATCLYRPSLPVGLQGYILYRHRAVV